MRIGKPLPERSPAQRFDSRLEWERDGQYYHYLTRWMHALQRCAEEWGDEKVLKYGVELAQTAHNGFAYDAQGEKRLYWKMSIDLARPLVPSMGQHDALDGLVAAAGLHTAATGSTLNLEIAELAQMCAACDWSTSDPLGAGLLLTDAFLLSRSSEFLARSRTSTHR